MALTKERQQQPDKAKAMNGIEICYAVQQWGLKNDLRLFGIRTYVVERKNNGKYCDPIITAIGFFTDRIGFRGMSGIFFDVKEEKGRIKVSRWKGKHTGYKWPIKLLRTKKFITKNIIPVYPLYGVLVCRKLILPFQSTMKSKDWNALPFEEFKGIKVTEI